MPEITELLDATTPRDVPPVDVADLARRAHARQRRLKVASAAGALGVVLAAVATAITLWPENDPNVTTNPSVIDLDEPIGRWSPAPEPAYSVPEEEVFSGRLSDGRMLAWGGYAGAEDGGRPIYARDGGIYDPETDSWEAIPAAPLEDFDDYFVRLEGDRLVVVPIRATPAGAGAAVYDAAERQWVSAPPVPAELADAMNSQVTLAWDGQHLAVVHVQNSPEDLPNSTWRWQLSDSAWQAGQPAPLGPRSVPGASRNGPLAIWGGGGGPLGDQPLADGAIYDLPTDTWQTMAPTETAGRIEPWLMWFERRLLVAGGEGAAAADEELGGLVAYDPGTTAWTTLGAAPDVTSIDRSSPPYGEGDELLDAVDDFVVSPVAGGSFDESSSWWFLQDGSWQEAPFRDLHKLDGLVLATSAGSDAAGSFVVVVRSEEGEWLDAAEAPFDSADVAVAVVSDTKLVVVTLTNQTWVLDLAAE